MTSTKLVHLSKVIFHKIVNLTLGGKLYPRKLRIPNSSRSPAMCLGESSSVIARPMFKCL